MCRLGRCCSAHRAGSWLIRLSDLFHEELAVETLDTLHAVMAIAHWHRFLVLHEACRTNAPSITPIRRRPSGLQLRSTISRRPSCLRLGFGGERGCALRAAPARSAGAGARRQWAERARPRDPSDRRRRRGQPGQPVGPAGLDPWPLPNLWLGVSVEDHGEDRPHRPAICRRRRRCAGRALNHCSDPVRSRRRTGRRGLCRCAGRRPLRLDGRAAWCRSPRPAWRPLDWVVAGGEIGAGARPTEADWVRGLRDRCVAAGVPFFFKGWGEWAPEPDGIRAANGAPRSARRGPPRRRPLLGRDAAGDRRGRPDRADCRSTASYTFFYANSDA